MSDRYICTIIRRFVRCIVSSSFFHSHSLRPVALLGFLVFFFFFGLWYSILPFVGLSESENKSVLLLFFGLAVIGGGGWDSKR